MLINKMGKYHMDYGINCHDVGFHTGAIKFVADGCGGSPHPEVGAKLFARYLCKYTQHVKEPSLQSALDLFFYRYFELITFPNSVTDENKQFINDYLLFTALFIQELNDCWSVQTAGDGYVINQFGDDFTFIPLAANEPYPPFYAYNLLPASRLAYHIAGVHVYNNRYPKDSKLTNVGLASDGIRYILNGPKDLYNEFIDILRENKTSAMQRFINRNQSLFQDDVTIVL